MPESPRICFCSGSGIVKTINRTNNAACTRVLTIHEGICFVFLRCGVGGDFFATVRLTGFAAEVAGVTEGFGVITGFGLGFGVGSGLGATAVGRLATTGWDELVRFWVGWEGVEGVGCEILGCEILGCAVGVFEVGVFEVGVELGGVVACELGGDWR